MIEFRQLREEIMKTIMLTACMICTGMCGNGALIGKEIILPVL